MEPPRVFWYDRLQWMRTMERPCTRGAVVTFNEVLSQTIAMLQQHGRVSYRALKRQFAIDDAFLEDLKYELIAVQQRAVDQDDTVLVWMGETGAATAPMPAPATSVAVPSPDGGKGAVCLRGRDRPQMRSRWAGSPQPAALRRGA